MRGVAGRGQPRTLRFDMDLEREYRRNDILRLPTVARGRGRMTPAQRYDFLVNGVHPHSRQSTQRMSRSDMFAQAATNDNSTNARRAPREHPPLRTHRVFQEMPRNDVFAQAAINDAYARPTPRQLRAPRRLQDPNAFAAMSGINHSAQARNKMTEAKFPRALGVYPHFRQSSAFYGMPRNYDFAQAAINDSYTYGGRAPRVHSNFHKYNAFHGMPRNDAFAHAAVYGNYAHDRRDPRVHPNFRKTIAFQEMPKKAVFSQAAINNNYAHARRAPRKQPQLRNRNAHEEMPMNDVFAQAAMCDNYASARRVPRVYPHFRQSIAFQGMPRNDVFAQAAIDDDYANGRRAPRNHPFLRTPNAFQKMPRNYVFAPEFMGRTEAHATPSSGQLRATRQPRAQIALRTMGSDGYSHQGSNYFNHSRFSRAPEVRPFFPQASAFPRMPRNDVFAQAAIDDDYANARRALRELILRRTPNAFREIPEYDVFAQAAIDDAYAHVGLAPKQLRAPRQLRGQNSSVAVTGNGHPAQAGYMTSQAKSSHAAGMYSHFLPPNTFEGMPWSDMFLQAAFHDSHANAIRIPNPEQQFCSPSHSRALTVGVHIKAEYSQDVNAATGPFAEYNWSCGRGQSKQSRKNLARKKPVRPSAVSSPAVSKLQVADKSDDSQESENEND